ncbi:Ig-like domain-containing protein [Crocinitomicaceae bacterium]|nr:Ig-like domain-containing protein [Crocinitomicaceae bacterium]
MLTFRYLIIIVLLTSACAQVGSISGGEKDVTAPRIEACNPSDGQLNAEVGQMTIEFDEFVKLQNPAENIILLPANIEYEYSIKGKVLQIDFQEELKENTTYSLYLNGAIKDITEGNDSLIQIAFSTGPEIDKNEAYFIVSDGFTGKLSEDVFIGLYDSLTQIEPTYFSKSDEQGYSRLRALKEGSFFYAAFIDENKNRIRDRDEIQFASKTSIYLDSTFSDTLNLSITTPKVELFNIDGKFVTPYILELSIPNWVSFDALKFKDLDLDVLYTSNLEENTRRYIVPEYLESIEINIDTLNKKVRNEEDLSILSLINPIKKLELFPDDCCIKLDFEAPIYSLNGKFSMVNLNDSSVIEFDSSQISFDVNQVVIDLKNQSFSKAMFNIDSATVSTINGIANEKVTFIVDRKVEEDLGIINVIVNSDLESWFIELFQNKKLVSVQTGFSKSEPVSFVNLKPGNYDFNIVEDKNKNSRWDPFNPKDYTGPEKRYIYNRTIKVKANWEHEVDFIITE